MSEIVWDSLKAWWPELIVSVGALLVVLLGVWTKRTQPAIGATWFTLFGGGAALWFAPAPTSTSLFFGLIVADPLSLVFRWLALGTTALVVLMVMSSDEQTNTLRGEYLGLLLFITVGLMLMAEASHLLMAYVAMELVSLSAYILVGLLPDKRSAEAALKYLLFGAFSSGLMLYGMSLLFGLTGSLGFRDILQASGNLSGGATGLLAVAVTLMLAGLAFKISMVPFHMWTPDAYEGAPIPVTALLSVGPKAAGLALVLRITEALAPAWSTVGPLLGGLTVITMTLGNLVALSQTNVKRLFAYSTIGQVGYLLIGLSVHTPKGVEALLLYLVAYLFMNLGAFACIVAVVNDTHNETLEAFRGLSKRSPVLALLCTLFLLSLAGIPPLLGFFGKFLLFGSAIESGHLWLAVAGIINSAIALYYYVNLIRLMYLIAPDRVQPLRPTGALRLAIGLCGAATLLLGLFPGALLARLGASVVVNLL